MTKTPATKKKQAALAQERNIRYETIIIIEAAILVLSAVVFICWLPLYFINVHMPVALIIVSAAIASLFIQGLIVFKQSCRTDQYQQRIAALAMTVVYPLVQFIILALLYISQVGPFSSAFREAAHTALGTILAFNGSLPVILLMVACTTIGSLWLWKIIITPEGVSYWQPRPADQLSEAEKIKQERGLRYRKIGVTLMVRVPFALICAFMFVITLLYIVRATILFAVMMAMSAVLPYAVILSFVVGLVYMLKGEVYYRVKH
mgnify:CR=1 FL=1